MATPEDGALAVRRIDQESGDRVWESEVEARGDTEIDDGGENVIVSYLGSLDALAPGGFRDGDVTGVVALDADDGSPAWTWPEAIPDGVIRAKVVGADPDTSRVYALEYVRSGPDSEPETSLVALDGDGSEAWREPMDSELCEAALWDDAVVLSCETPLFALDAETGAQQWTSSSEFEVVGGILRLGGDRSVDVGDGNRLLIANDGLLQIDVETGEVSEPVTEEELGGFVSGVDVVGDHLVLAVRLATEGTGVFVLDLEGVP